MRLGIDGLVAGLVLVAAAGTATAEPLRYTFGAGKDLAYRVTIEAKLPNGLETRSGLLGYVPKSVDAETGRMTLECGSRLLTPGDATPRTPSSVTVTIGSRGEAVDGGGLTGAQLPFLLGPDWQLVFVALPHGEQKTWRGEREITVTAESWPYLPATVLEQKPRTAKEVVTYTLSNDMDPVVVIRSTSNLSVPQAGKAPAIQRSGMGQIVFDRAQGLVTSIETSYTIRTSENNVAVNIPVKVKVEMLAPQQAKAALAGPGSPLPGMVAPPEARGGASGAPEPVAATEAEVDMALRELNNGRQPKWIVLGKLAAMRVVASRQDAVIAAAGRVLQAQGQGPLQRTERLGAIRVLELWGTGREAALLAPIAADHGDAIQQMTAIRALAKMGTAEAAEAITAGLYSESAENVARASLIKMGATAEPAVIGLLKDGNAGVREEACGILAEIGTGASIAPMKAMMEREKSATAKRKVEQALRQVESRQPRP